MTPAANVDANPRVIIVGAGLAGIATGVALKTKLGFHNFTIYEKAGDVGGTWRESTYPGCGCDVPAHWYSLSSEPNPSWDHHYASQPDLHAYWRAIFDKHALHEQTVFNTTVTRSKWDEDLQRWTVWTQNDGHEFVQHAEVLVFAIGGFMSPEWPRDMQGLDSFKGDLWHSAQWRHDVNLCGKRVGVIGNGCSAAQFVPQLAREQTTEVINFCRTPQWYLPMTRISYSDRMKWIFAHVPGVQKLFRAWIMFRSDISFLIFDRDRQWLVDQTRKRLEAYIKSQHADYPIPDFAPGCKRIIVDPGYLACLNQENVSLRWDGIESVVEQGIKLKSGEIVSLDVIILGTGYSVDAADLDVTGRNSTLQEYYKAQNGSTAYLGLAMPGFPNCFMLLGPNVATGHASVIFSEESQIDLALQLIKPVLEGKITSVDVKDRVCEEYNDWLQSRLKHSVWSECHSFYHQNRDSTSKIIATFPGPVALFYWICRRPRWGQWNVRGASPNWRKTEFFRQVYEFLVSSLLVAFFAVPWSVLS